MKIIILIIVNGSAAKSHGFRKTTLMSYLTNYGQKKVHK
jgi:hypothetical protein